MKANHARYIARKIFLSEEEDAAIRKSCAAVGKTFSARGRELLLQHIPAHRTPRAPRRVGAKLGTFSFPGRKASAPVPLRI